MSNNININIGGGTTVTPSAGPNPQPSPLQAPASLSPHRKLIEEVISKWKYGELHYHSEIESILGIPYKVTTSMNDIEINRRYNTAISRANAVLLRKGKLLKCIKGDGYELLQHKEYCVASMQKVKEARNKAKKATIILKHTDMNQLTTDEKVRHDSVASRVLPFFNIATRVVNRINAILYPSQQQGTPRSMGSYVPEKDTGKPVE